MPVSSGYCREINYMDKYVTGNVIRRLRENKNMTQEGLAERIHVSSKAVSKWETGQGFPDISLIESLAQALGISVIELLSGEDIRNGNRSFNMLKSKFYVCPVCGNAIHSTGEAVVSCCGITLPPLEAENAENAASVNAENAASVNAENVETAKNSASVNNESTSEGPEHEICVERVEDEYYVTLDHPMTKDHYISFLAALSDQDVQFFKLYPEGNAECRFRMSCVRRIYAYCNRHGLYAVNVGRRSL